jgi:hypothetical protein
VCDPVADWCSRSAGDDEDVVFVPDVDLTKADPPGRGDPDPIAESVASVLPAWF